MRSYSREEMYLWLINEQIDALYEERKQFIDRLEREYCIDEADSLIHQLAHQIGFFPKNCIHKK